MKKLFLILPLAVLLFSTQGLAGPPKGGATGGHDLSSCDLKPKEQTKVKVKDKSGKTHHICTGLAVCGGKATAVSCKVSEREACPTAKKCITFNLLNIDLTEYQCSGTVKFEDKTMTDDMELAQCFGEIIHHETNRKMAIMELTLLGKTDPRTGKRRRKVIILNVDPVFNYANIQYDTGRGRGLEIVFFDLQRDTKTKLHKNGLSFEVKKDIFLKEGRQVLMGIKIGTKFEIIFNNWKSNKR
ncbi:MAG: hypothetical protein DRQ88_01430 [Epsilonproteobacteria bacterium]|nr:MAG: hypothetical protein DRQ89_05500 [Campylobacterota bacterium]RLA67954.1 MAG: hypothetical protein DRQ88_01430 [Campylobacterota bacterium]